MQTKLTLRMEKDLIESAKEWADKNQVSLSQAVAMFFEQVTLKKLKNLESEPLHRLTKSLVGIARKNGGNKKNGGKRTKAPNEKEVRKIILSRAEEKHP